MPKEKKDLKLENIIEEVKEMKTLIEAKVGGKKTYYLEGICMQAEIVNGNGRKYQKWEMEREIERYNREYIAKNRAFGELDHPSSSTMNMSKMSHLFIEPLRMEGNNVICKAEILDTIWGNIVKVAIDKGIPFGFSSRGRGELEAKDDCMLVNNFEIITPADIVENPSAPDARPSAFMEMVTEAVAGNPDISKNFDPDFITEIKNDINTTSKSKLDEAIIKVYWNIINNIKKMEK